MVFPRRERSGCLHNTRSRKHRTSRTGTGSRKSYSGERTEKCGAGLTARALSQVITAMRRGLFPRLFVCRGVVSGGRGVFLSVCFELVERQGADHLRAGQLHVERAVVIAPGNPDALVGGLLAVAVTHLGDVGWQLGSLAVAAGVGFGRLVRRSHGSSPLLRAEP